MKTKQSPSGGWENYTPEQKAERVRVATAKRLETMAANKARKAKRKLPATMEVVETISIPAPRAPQLIRSTAAQIVRPAAPRQDLEALAQLIIAVWRQL